MKIYDGKCPACDKRTIQTVETRFIEKDEYYRMHCTYCGVDFYVKRDDKRHKYYFVDDFPSETTANNKLS